MSTRTAAAGAALAVVALGLAGCSGDDEAAEPPPPSPTVVRDAAASVQALAVAPADTERLLVTDLRAARGALGLPDDFSSAASEADRDAFWADLDADTAAPTDGLLRPDEETLLADHGFGAEDLDWEATFESGDGDGWAGGFGDDVDLDDVQAAIDDGVGVLDGATLDPATGVVSVGGADDPAEAWSAEEGIDELVPDRPGVGVLVASACVPIPPDEEILVAADDGDLEDLDAWSVTFGETLATVRLGEDRDDVSTRLELAGLDDEFTRVFTDGVAEEGSGRIGFTTDDPRAAVDLALDDGVPVATCPD